MVNQTDSPTTEHLKAVLPGSCRLHSIQRVEGFGSVVTGLETPGSDVDLLVTFRPNVNPGLEFFGLEEKLQSLLGVNIDLLTRRSGEASRNSIRRSILDSAREIDTE